MVLVFAVIVALPCTGAWSNGGYSADQSNPDYGTHDWIAEMALSIQSRDVTFLKTTYHSKFLLGTEAPDNPEFIGDTANHHIYFGSDHLLDDDVCAERASELYQLALGYIRLGNYELAAFDIGAMAHYIADLGVFGHTMGASTDWGSETHHADYEDEIQSRTDSLPTPTGIILGDSTAYNAALGLAEAITFGSGSVKANTWMDDNYSWANATFVASAMASLDESVVAVASAIHHLMIEAGAASPPGAPTAVAATADGSDVRLTWSPPSEDGGADITAYRIYHSTSLEDPVQITTVSGSTSNWTHEGAHKGKTHHYWVVAVNSAGDSDMSQVTSVKIPRDSISLFVPIGVSAISIALASLGALLWRRNTKGRSRR